MKKCGACINSYLEHEISIFILHPFLSLLACAFYPPGHQSCNLGVLLKQTENIYLTTPSSGQNWESQSLTHYISVWLWVSHVPTLILAPSPPSSQPQAPPTHQGHNFLHIPLHYGKCSAVSLHECNVWEDRKPSSWHTEVCLFQRGLMTSAEGENPESQEK